MSCLAMFSKSVYQFKVDLRQAYKKIRPYPQRVLEAFSKQVGVLLSKQKKWRSEENGSPWSREGYML